MYDCTNEIYMIQDNYGTLNYELYNPMKTRRLPHSVLDVKSILEEMEEDVEIINVLDLFVSPIKRNNGIATKLIDKLIRRGKDSIILLNAGASTKEFPTEPSDTELLSIVDSITNFYINKGFYNINNYVGHYQIQNTMIYTNEKGNKLIEYLKGEI